MAKNEKPSEQPSQQEPASPAVGAVAPPNAAAPPSTFASPTFTTLADALRAQGMQNVQTQAVEEAQRAVDTVPRAIITENADGVVARPPPGVHLSKLGNIVHGNFIGRGWRVQSGTPATDLPTRILREILESDASAIGPWAPPPPQVLL